MHLDYPTAARVRRKRLLKLKSDITSRNSNVEVQIKGQTMQFGGKSFYFDKNNNLICEGENGLTVLEQMMNDSGDRCLTPMTAGGDDSNQRYRGS